MAAFGVPNLGEELKKNITNSKKNIISQLQRGIVHSYFYRASGAPRNRWPDLRGVIQPARHKK